jgi:hypothetical protein
MESDHGQETSERALRTAQAEVLKSVLRAPLSTLQEDLRLVCEHNGLEAEIYVERMRLSFDDLLPEGKQDSASATHLNSVLLALSHLEKNRVRATRLTS